MSQRVLSFADEAVLFISGRLLKGKMQNPFKEIKSKTDYYEEHVRLKLNEFSLKTHIFFVYGLSFSC